MPSFLFTRSPLGSLYVTKISCRNLAIIMLESWRPMSPISDSLHRGSGFMNSTVSCRWGWCRVRPRKEDLSSYCRHERKIRLIRKAGGLNTIKYKIMTESWLYWMSTVLYSEKRAKDEPSKNEWDGKSQAVVWCSYLPYPDILTASIVLSLPGFNPIKTFIATSFKFWIS